MRKYFIEYEEFGATYRRFVKENSVEMALIRSGYMDQNHISSGQLKIIYSEPMDKENENTI